tara:strand:+ start:563 stop:2548 length:1986 start_codon:yes stop_codon:yes gene_type:complete
MATFDITLALGSPLGSYPLLGSANVTPGTTVTVNVADTGNYDTATETGGAPNLGTAVSTPATFTYSVAGSGGSTQFLYFFGSQGSPYWDNVTNYRGKIQLNIQSPQVCQTTQLSGSVSVSIDNTFSSTAYATVVATSGYGQYCSSASRAWTGSGAAPAFTPGQTIAVSRGTTYFFHAANTSYTGGYISSAATTVPYLAPDTSITPPANFNDGANDGEWISGAMSGITGSFNNYIVTNGTTTSSTPYYHTIEYPTGSGLSVTKFIQTDVGGTTFWNTNPANTPAGATTRYYIWASRTSASGGAGGQGWPPSWTYTNSFFDVTRAASFNEAVSDATGNYYDIYTGTGAEHSVSFTGLATNKYYQVSNTNGDAYFVSGVGGTQQGYTQFSSGSGTKVVRDQSVGTVTEANTSTVTYYLWRADDSSGTNAAYTNKSYTRTIASFDRLTVNNQSVSTSNTFSYTIPNTFVGHTYYIRNNSITGSILNTTVASGTSVSISITLGAGDIPNVGNSVTHHLTTQAPQMSIPADDHDTSQSYTVTRTGTTSGSAGSSTGEYGMQIRNTSNVLIYDSDSRMGRFIVGSTRLPASGTIAAGATSAQVTVTGLESNSNWQIMVIPGEGGTSSFYGGHNFTIQYPAANKFTVTNTGTSAAFYNYFVVKSGDTDS